MQRTIKTDRYDTQPNPRSSGAYTESYVEVKEVRVRLKPTAPVSDSAPCPLQPSAVH
jgi:hypothetical protein